MRLWDTIRLWADGQNGLNDVGLERGRALQAAVCRALDRLSREPSLGDLAAAYYADSGWWTRVAEEFRLGPAEAQIARDAAYWQRFMELRHPRRAEKRSP